MSIWPNDWRELITSTTLTKNRTGESSGRVTCRNCRRRFAPSIAALSYSSVGTRSEEHTSELQSRGHLVCRLLLEKKKKQITAAIITIELTIYIASKKLPLDMN